MEYFAARLFYTELKEYDPSDCSIKDLKSFFPYLNIKSLFQTESDVLKFVQDMVKENTGNTLESHGVVERKILDILNRKETYE